MYVFRRLLGQNHIYYVAQLGHLWKELLGEHVTKPCD